MAATSARFDAFLSYSRRDARAAEALAGRLAGEAGLAVWLDRARLQPGASWRGEIEEAMNRSGAAVVLWGPDGLGPVQRQERDLAYALRDARPGFEVLYVFLPGTPPPQGSWANVDTWIRFEGGLDEADPFARLVAALKGEAPPAGLAAGLPDEPAPYRGLAAFGVDDRRFFFGRSAELGEMQERLAHHPFLAVLGPSGSGKTSLVQAGLLARLPAAEWEKVVVRPGTRPLRALAGALARLRPVDPLAAADDLTRRLEASPGDLPELLDLLLPEGKRLALVVDRLEELFTLAESAEEVGRFLAAVLALAPARGRSWVIATMRADFYGRLGRHPELAGEVVDHQLYIKDMGPAAVAEVIEAPAAQVGAVFEKGLAARVRDDASQDGAVVLPLLQHALDLLWRKRRGRWLTWEAYEEVGGVQGALRYHADRAVEALGAAEREVARGLLTRLVWIEESTAAATAGRRLDEASLAGGDPRREQVLQRLADERLVVLRGAGDQATVELVHDTLPLHWQRLRGWVQEDREFLLWRQRLRADLAEWQRTGGDEGTLLRGAPLVEAERWLAERRADLGSDEAAFIAASTAERDRERTARERLRRQVVGGLAAGLLVALGLALLAFFQWRESERQRRVSLSRQLAAQGTPQVAERLDLALLLGVEAYRAADTLEAQQLLLQGLERGRQIDAILHPPGEVACLAMDPSSRLLATGFADGTIQLWDLRTRRPAGEVLKSPSGSCDLIAFGPGGKTLAVFHSGSSLTADLWDLSAARPGRRRVAGEGGPVFLAPAFSPRRTTMALAGEESLAFWDLETRRPLGRPIALPPDPLALDPLASLLEEALPSPLQFVAEKALLVHRKREGWTLWHAAVPPVPEPLPGVAVASHASSADGRLLALGTEEGSILLWDLASRRRLEPIETGLGAVSGLAFWSDGRLLSAHSQGRLFLWDPRHPRPAAQLFWQRGDFELKWVVPGGGFVIGDTHIGTRQLVQLGPDGDQTRASFIEGEKPIVSPDGSAVVIWRGQGLRLYGLRNETDEWESLGDFYIRAGGFTPDGRKLVTLDSALREVTLWDTTPRRAVGRRLAEDLPLVSDCLAWSPDGETLAWGGWRSVSLWRPDSPRRIERLPGHRGSVGAVAWSPDGRTLASCDDTGSLLLWNVASTVERRGRPLSFSPPGASQEDVTTLVFSADGKTLVAGTSESRVLRWDLASGRIQQLFGESTGFAVHPSRPLVAIATEQNEIPLVDLESGKPLARPLQAPAPVVEVELSPDGETLAAGLEDGRVALLDLPEGKAGRILAGGDSSSLSFDGAGDLLATGDAAIWDLASGRPALPPLPGNLARARLNPRRPLLASTVSGHGSLILWDLDVRHWARRACRIANRNLTREEWQRYVGAEIPYRETCPELPGPEGPG